LKQKQVNLIAILAVTLIFNTMTNSLRKLALSCAVILIFGLGLIANETDGNEAFVLKIENLTEVQNAAIFHHFFSYKNQQ